MLSLLPLRRRHPSEAAGHAVRPDDEVKVDVEDGREQQRHQAEALQSPGHVLKPKCARISHSEDLCSG